MKKSSIPSDWRVILLLAIRKFDYEKAVLAFNAKNVFVRFFLSLFGKKPANPCPGWPSETLASRYVQLFNEQYHIGRRKDINCRDTIYVGLKYQVEDRMPVLNATYMEDGTGYSMRMKFNRQGGYEFRPCPYPESEFCFAVDKLPVRVGLKELEDADKMIPFLKGEITHALASL